MIVLKWWEYVTALIMSLMYFLGSIGIGTNDPVTINITDSEGSAVTDAVVYYEQQKKPYGYNYSDLVYIPIGTTDENGNVQWEDQEYGDQLLMVVLSEDDFPGSTYKVNISRTSNETINIVLYENMYGGLSL
ncbi:MAG: YbfJ family protein [Clostridiales bacterium]|nr:YbfJ family protein [Clostridiales bacterium]